MGCSLIGISLNDSARGTEACPTRISQLFRLHQQCTSSAYALGKYSACSKSTCREDAKI